MYKIIFYIYFQRGDHVPEFRESTLKKISNEQFIFKLFLTALQVGAMMLPRRSMHAARESGKAELIIIHKREIDATLQKKKQTL